MKLASTRGGARETRHSVGARLWRIAKPLDYNFEFIYQWGSFGNGDIRAWTAASDTGYTFESLPLHPRLGLKADITSGDRDPNNPDLQTFNPLFPKGAYFSEDGLIGPANHIDLNPSVDLHFTEGLTLSVNWDFFWRESTHDGIYNNCRCPCPIRKGQHGSIRRESAAGPTAVEHRPPHYLHCHLCPLSCRQVSPRNRTRKGRGLCHHLGYLQILTARFPILTGSGNKTHSRDRSEAGVVS